MMLRFSLNQPEAADRIESAVKDVLASGLRTADIHSEGTTNVSAPARWATRSWPPSPQDDYQELAQLRFVAPLPGPTSRGPKGLYINF